MIKKCHPKLSQAMSVTLSMAKATTKTRIKRQVQAKATQGLLTVPAPVTPNFNLKGELFLQYLPG